ncbi:MAG: tripartite tricarboxylate transporter TctB family protein [Burkholderiales bacterium]
MRTLMHRDVLAALVLFVIGAVSLTQAGADPMNWAFPLLATYFILFAAAVLAVRVVFAVVAAHAPDIVCMSAEDRIVARDVLWFLLISLGYLLLMYGLGFWLASFLMLSLASLYLTLDKTRRNLRLAVVVPLATCVVAYVVFEHVFYVPVPRATWWPLGG